MIVSFFESIKYTGHLLPVSFLRIFLGYYYLGMALEKFRGDFLTKPVFAAEIAEKVPSLVLPSWYKGFLETLVIPYWQTSAFIIVGLEFAIAISYLLGYVTRPLAIVAAVMSLNFFILSSPVQGEFFRTLIAIHLVLAWIGAGRCLGLDYYFFKRQRGLWW